MAVGLNDIFHTLLHPSGRGQLSHWIAAGVWRLSRISGHRLGHIAGPAVMVAVIIVWALLQAVGWALIYYPHVPGGFSYSPGLNPARYNTFAEALYISLVSLATVGYGDAIPVHPWIRLFSPIQALTGFALLTAALSWFSQIHPALARRRTLAIRLHLLEDNRYAENLNKVGVSAGSRVLEEMAADITGARVDMKQNTVTYYFRESDPRMSLAASVPYAMTLSATARNSPIPEIRLNGRILQAALDDLAEQLTKQFSVPGNSPEEIFTSFRADQGHPPHSSDTWPATTSRTRPRRGQKRGYQTPVPRACCASSTVPTAPPPPGFVPPRPLAGCSGTRKGPFACAPADLSMAGTTSTRLRWNR